ncbi:hypothetical protein BC629DRAFT_1536423 [Irpex lacteus]|nr:hypothetical protein BC629DRAFT_1536423 [Irpex lacteus]
MLGISDGMGLRSLTAYFLFLCLFISFPEPSYQASRLGKRDFKHLSKEEIASLVSSPDPVRNIDPHNPSSHLSKILIPRAPDTANNTFVREYIISTLKKLNWDIEEDSFNATTPYGVKRMTNVIATKDPKAPRRVILSAHFDSKYFSTYPQNQFVGATDSAAPCAFMLDVAEALNPLLEKRMARLADEDDDMDDEDEDLVDTTLQLVFFDGEEAFKDWTATDSIYGARNLVQKWSSTYITPNSKRRLIASGWDTELSSIEHLILLDLLGAPRPLIRSSFVSTAWLYDEMVNAEKALGDSGAYAYGNDDGRRWSSYFLPRGPSDHNYGGVEDDHIPFLRMGVDVLHVIANPFPTVWHTLRDDASALDIPTMRRWNLILRVFMCEYLGLKPEGTEKARSNVHRVEDELVSGRLVVAGSLLSLAHSSQGTSP